MLTFFSLSLSEDIFINFVFIICHLSLGKNQWSLSRPLLGLILLNEDYFQQLRQSLIQNQPPDKQQSMAQWFEDLMEGIERNLTTKNRDHFTQNVSLFRRGNFCILHLIF